MTDCRYKDNCPIPYLYKKEKEPLIAEVSNGTISLVVYQMPIENLKEGLNDIFEKYDLPLSVTECVTNKQFLKLLEILENKKK